MKPLSAPDLNRIPSAAIRKAIRCIEEGFSEPISSHELAALVGLSDGHFCRAFKQATGMRVTHYVAQLRIDYATRTLLVSTDLIGRIGISSGYSSLAQFNRAFKKLTKVTPSQYRARRQSEPQQLDQSRCQRTI